MSFNIDDYVDVAERIRIFREKHPNGSLQSDVTMFHNADGFLTGVLCKATAWRTPDDAHPANGHSFLGVPGKTPYTKDSEVENAETSAWGRAIVAALAADTKKVASADEVRAKHEGSADEHRQTGAGSSSEEGSPAPPPSSDGWTWPFGKHKGKSLADTPVEYLEWFLDKSDKEDIKQRIREFQTVGALSELGGGFYDAETDSDVPFDRTIDGLGN